MANTATLDNLETNFRKNLEEHIDAAFSGMYVISSEPEEAANVIARICDENNYNLWQWDADRGLINSNNEVNKVNPLEAVRAVRHTVPTSNRDMDYDERETGILLLHNFHRYMEKGELVQAIANVLYEGKDWRYFLVIISPNLNLPVELEKKFAIIEHELPNREELREIADEIVQSDSEMPDSMDRLLDAAAGLTREEAQNSFALSIVREEKLVPRVVWKHKEQMLKKIGMLKPYEPREFDTFEYLAGAENLKYLCKELYSPRDDLNHYLLKSKGILYVGPSGTGKTQFARCLGGEIGYRAVEIDMGAGMDKYVGGSQDNHKRAQDTLAAMGNVIGVLNEGEKQVSSDGNDSGTSKQVFGSWLQFAEDTSHDVIIFATCNDVSKLPPEFSRPGRFSGTVFCDLPSREVREAIWAVYMTMFGIKEQPLPDDEGWVGAEIQDCCRKAIQFRKSLIEAAPYVSISSKKYPERLQSLREWADGVCIDADDIDNPVYTMDKEKLVNRTSSGSRSVSRKKKSKGSK